MGIVDKGYLYARFPMMIIVLKRLRRLYKVQAELGRRFTMRGQRGREKQVNESECEQVNIGVGESAKTGIQKYSM